MFNKKQQELTGSELLLQKMPLYAQARRQYQMRFYDRNAECNTLAYRANTYPLLHLIRCCDKVIDGYSIDESLQNEAFTGIQENKHNQRRNWQRASLSSAATEELSYATNESKKEEYSLENRASQVAKEEQNRVKTENVLLRTMLSSNAITESVVSNPQVDISVGDNNALVLNAGLQRQKTNHVKRQTASYAHDNARESNSRKGDVINKAGGVYNKTSSSSNTDAAAELWYESTPSTAPSPSQNLTSTKVKEKKSYAMTSSSVTLQKEWQEANEEHVTSLYKRNLRWYVQSSTETRELLDSIHSNVIPAHTNICNGTNMSTLESSKAMSSTSASTLVPTQFNSHTDNKQPNNTIVVYNAAKQVLNDRPTTPIHTWANSLWSILQTSYTTSSANNHNRSSITDQVNGIDGTQAIVTSVSSPVFMIDESTGVTSHDRTQVASYLKRVKWIMQQQQINNPNGVSESNESMINQAQSVTHPNTRYNKSWHSLTEGERVQREMEHTLAERKRFRRERVNQHDNVVNVNNDDSGSDNNVDHKEMANE